ncbi:hypothetical protein BDW69DRAFT_161908 [Aspergillus filifer]
MELLSSTIIRLDQLRVLDIKGNNSDGCCHRDEMVPNLGQLTVWREERLQRVNSARFHKLFLKSISSPILTNLESCKLYFYYAHCWDISRSYP